MFIKSIKNTVIKKLFTDCINCVKIPTIKISVRAVIKQNDDEKSKIMRSSREGRPACPVV